MSKKLLCLILCIVALLPLVLTGCSNSGEIDTENTTANRENTTLNFWIVVDDKMDLGDESTVKAINRMQEAFNEACKQKYCTKVVFNFCKQDAYMDLLNGEFNRIRRDEERQTVIKNESGEVVMLQGSYDGTDKYPMLENDQMDLLLVAGKDMYTELVDSRMLDALNTELTGNYKGILKKIYTELLEYSAIDSRYYAIPNTTVIGSYQYLLVDKQLADKYYLEEKDITTVSSVYDFVQKVAKGEDRAKIAPIYAPFDYPTVQFWSVDGSGTSVIGSEFWADKGRGDLNNATTVSNLLLKESYRTYQTMMFDAKVNGYFATGDERYAVRVIEGTYGDRFKYQNDYYVKVVNCPRVTEEDVYGSMFAISKYSTNRSRAMEIMQDLLTSTDGELRNILQYGVENEEYTKNEDGTVTIRSTSEYFMNQEYTGSMFNVYPCTNYGQDANYYTNSANHNKERCLEPYYECESYLEGVERGKWVAIDEFSEILDSRLSLCVTVEEYKAALEEIRISFETETASALVSSDFCEYVNAMLEEYQGNGELDLTTIAGALRQFETDYKK